MIRHDIETETQPCFRALHGSESTGCVGFISTARLVIVSGDWDRRTLGDWLGFRYISPNQHGP